MLGGLVAAFALVLAGGFAAVEARPPTAPEPRAPGRPGDLVTVPVAGAPRDRAPIRFIVEVEGRLPVDPRAFALVVERTLADRRGWAARGKRFIRVGREPADFRVALVSPAMTDRLCAPLSTNGRYSCATEERAVLNFQRWQRGSRAYGGDLRRYRIYMINHEVGHVLGNGHASCPRGGAKAPVMMQQTKGVGGCRPNPWPLAAER